MTSNEGMRLIVVLHTYINSVAKHPRNLNYSTKHVYNAQRL